MRRQKSARPRRPLILFELDVLKRTAVFFINKTSGEHGASRQYANSSGGVFLFPQTSKNAVGSLVDFRSVAVLPYVGEDDRCVESVEYAQRQGELEEDAP